MYVLEAEWNGNKVVLKTPKSLGTDDRAVRMSRALFPSYTRREDVQMSTQDFVHHVRSLVYGEGQKQRNGVQFQSWHFNAHKLATRNGNQLHYGEG